MAHTMEAIFGMLSDKPSPDHMCRLYDRYRAMMSRGDVDGTIALFAKDASWQEPVGSPPEVGHDAIRARYAAAINASGGAIPMKAEGVVRVAGNRAAANSIAETRIQGQWMTVETTNVVTCNEEGLITEMPVYVGSTNFKPIDT